MRYTVIADREDENDIIEEEQYHFIRQTLLQIGVPIEECLPEDYSEFTVQKKINLREILDKFSINLIRDNGLRIVLVDDGAEQKLAEWKMVKRIILVNGRDKSVQLTFEYWSALEDSGE